MKQQAVEARREFKDGLDGLLKLGEFVKIEIKELQGEVTLEDNRRRVADNILDDSVDSRVKIDLAITNKIDQLLNSQLEWERQRSIMQERLDKLEKNIAERQTTDDTSSIPAMITPKNAVTP